MALTPKLERQVLTNKIEHIDKRRAEIEGELSRYSARKVKDYRQSELETELKTLGAERRVTANKLAALDASQDKQANEQKQRWLDRKEAESRATLEHNIQKFEREGDYRSARLYRQELLNVRRRLEGQYS